MSLRVNITGSIAGFQSVLNQARASAQNFARQMRVTSTGSMAALGNITRMGLGALGVGGFAAAINSVKNYASNLTNLSSRTGASIEDLQRMGRAMRDNGAELEDLIKFWEKLTLARSAALKNPEGKEAKALGRLGVDAEALRTQSNVELSRTIAAKFQGDVNVEGVVATLAEAGIKGTGKLVAAFRAGLDQMYQDTNVMTEAQAEVLAELGNQWNDVLNEITVLNAGWLTSFVGWWKKMIDEIAGTFTGLWVGITRLFGGSSLKESFDAGLEAARQSYADFAEERENKEIEREERAKARRAAAGLTFTDLESSDAANAMKATKPGLFNASDLSKVGFYTSSALQSNPNLIVEREQLQVLRRIEEKMTGPLF